MSVLKAASKAARTVALLRTAVTAAAGRSNVIVELRVVAELLLLAELRVVVEQSLRRRRWALLQQQESWELESHPLPDPALGVVVVGTLSPRRAHVR